MIRIKIEIQCNKCYTYFAIYFTDLREYLIIWLSLIIRYWGPKFIKSLYRKNVLFLLIFLLLFQIIFFNVFNFYVWDIVVFFFLHVTMQIIFIHGIQHIILCKWQQNISNQSNNKSLFHTYQLFESQTSTLNAIRIEAW